MNCPKNVGNVAGYTRPTETGMEGGSGGGGGGRLQKNKDGVIILPSGDYKIGYSAPLAMF